MAEYSHSTQVHKQGAHQVGAVTHTTLAKHEYSMLRCEIFHVIERVCLDTYI